LSSSLGQSVITTWEQLALTGPLTLLSAGKKVRSEAA